MDKGNKFEGARSKWSAEKDAGHRRGVEQVLKSAHESTRVGIKEHPTKEGVFNICVPIGDDSKGHRDAGVYLSIPVTPEQPNLWRRATESHIADSMQASSKNPSERAKAQEPVAGLFSDVFTDYHYRGVKANSAQDNDPEARKMFKLQKLGAFASAKDVEEACWMFPSVPVKALGIDYQPYDHAREIPLYVQGPAGHYWPRDMGYVISQYWCPSPSGNHEKNVYVCSKVELAGLRIEKPKYYGMLWQVPEWMVARFGPMGVKTLEANNDTVEFYRYNMPPLVANISYVRSTKAVNENPDEHEAKQQMKLAFRDIMEDYPVALARLLEDDDLVATKEYMEKLESEDAKAQEKEKMGAADRADSEEPKASELLSSREWSAEAACV
jgi:hypothetical protein